MEIYMNKDYLNKLTKSDTYSLILFCIYRLTQDPKYSTLSELIYLLNEECLLNLCKYYGGLTIKIPTLDELEILIYSLLLYNNININNKSYEEALNELNCSNDLKDKIQCCYDDVTNILSEYSING